MRFAGRPSSSQSRRARVVFPAPSAPTRVMVRPRMPPPPRKMRSPGARVGSLPLHPRRGVRRASAPYVAHARQTTRGPRGASTYRRPRRSSQASPHRDHVLEPGQQERLHTRRRRPTRREASTLLRDRACPRSAPCPPPRDRARAHVHVVVRERRWTILFEGALHEGTTLSRHEIHPSESTLVTPARAPPAAQESCEIAAVRRRLRRAPRGARPLHDAAHQQQLDPPINHLEEGQPWSHDARRNELQESRRERSRLRPR